MATLNKETPEDRNPRRNSIGTPESLPTGANAGGSSSAGRKARRNSFGVPSTQKSTGEGGNIVPHYLRASTGSCHDFCKYGKKHAQSESRSPVVTPKRAAVKKEKVSKTVVPVERKKTIVTNLKTSPEPVDVIKQEISLPSKKAEVSKQILSTNRKAMENELKTPQRSTSNVRPKPSSSAPDISAGSNDGTKKKDIRTVKGTGMSPKTMAVKKVVAKATPTGSLSPKPSVSRVESSKARKYRNPKLVSPLKDQNRMQKTEIKPPITDKVQKKTLHVVEAESEAKPESIDLESVPPTTEIIKSPRSMELTNLTDSDNSQASFDKEILEEESSIIPPLSKSSQSSSDKEESSGIPPFSKSSQSSSDKEEPSIIPPVSKSSQSSSDKEESPITPHVFESSQSYSDKEVLEEEVEYTNDEEVLSSCDEELSEEESEYTDDEKAFVSDNDGEMETPVGDHNKIPRKGRMVTSEGKDDEAVKLKFRRGKVVDIRSENNGPRRLKFRRGRVMEGNEDGQRVTRKTFKKKVVHEETTDSNLGSVSVILKHQDAQGKKDAQVLYNNVIEETASKLVETRKSKVKALVGAFETVISLQDGKPSSTS